MNLCLQEIEDFADYIQQGKVKVCFLNPYPDEHKGEKAPISTYKKDGWVSLDQVLQNPTYNLGICFPDPQDKTDLNLCCIDIDGIKNKSEEIFFGSVTLLFNIILEGLQKRNLHPMVVKTQSGGYHIYIWTKNFTGQQHGFDAYLYPSKSILNFTARQEFIDYPSLVSILGHRMEAKVMEIFTQNTMTVAPGSVLRNGNKYSLLDCGVKRFGDISCYQDGNIEDLVFEILQENFFKYDPVKAAVATIINDNKEFSELSEENIKNIGNLIIETWPLIDGQKQEATLALGGFLFSRNISQKSIIALGDYVIDNKPDANFFKGSDEFERSGGFMKALLHDSQENIEKPKQGLTTLKNKFFGKYNVQKFQKILWLNTAPSVHQFYPKERSAEMYPRVTLNFNQKKIEYDVLKRVNIKDENGKPTDQYKEVIQPGNEIIQHMVSDLTYIDDISDPRTLDNIDKPIKFCLSTINIPSHTYILQNRDTLFQKYHKFEGAYHIKNKPIMEYIFMEYELLDLISTEEGSSRPGIYLSKDKKSIKKYIDSQNGLEEVQPVKPDREELQNALYLLTKINQTIPWTGDKFGAVVKLALLQPFGFVYKIYKKWVPGIILFGEAGTLKSTIGELLCQLSTPIDVHEDRYITNGSEMNSDFRMGRNFAYHSYPIVMNECLDLFSNQRSIEALKHLIDQKMFRSPGGENADTYYARSVPIITLNDELEAMSTREFARRFLSINLTIKDAYTQQEIYEKLSFLNKDNVQNSRFKELTVIGDFVFYFLSQHMEYFSYDIYTTMDLIIRELERETGMDLSWINVDLLQYIDIERDESTEMELESVLQALRRIFLQNKPMYVQGTEEDLLKNMIGREYHYIFFSKHREGIIIQRSFEQEFSKISQKVIKLKRVAEILSENYSEDISYKTMDIYGSTPEERKQKRGVYIPWNVFIQIMQVTTRSGQDIIYEQINGDNDE